MVVNPGFTDDASMRVTMQPYLFTGGVYQLGQMHTRVTALLVAHETRSWSDRAICLVDAA